MTREPSLRCRRATSTAPAPSYATQYRRTACSKMDLTKGEASSP
jgi:hypothetical protein